MPRKLLRAGWPTVCCRRLHGEKVERRWRDRLMAAQRPRPAGAVGPMVAGRAPGVGSPRAAVLAAVLEGVVTSACRCVEPGADVGLAEPDEAFLAVIRRVGSPQ